MNTAAQNKSMLELFESIWEVAKELAKLEPYRFQSEMYSHELPMRALGQALPQAYQVAFVKFTNEKTKDMDRLHLND